MLTVHQLMMKDTHLSHVLNSTGAPFSIENCIEYTDAVDFVIKRWSESVRAWDVDNSKIETDAYTTIMNVRFLFYDLEDGNPEIAFLDAIDTLNDFKQVMSKIAKSYSETPILAVWYGRIALNIQNRYQKMRRKIRDDV
jgi:hypothetical protein